MSQDNVGLKTREYFNHYKFIHLMNSNKNIVIDKNKLITQDELMKHTKLHDCWIVFDGAVYDISYFLKYHPGGADHLFEYAGKDITEDFKQVHQWVNIGLILEKCRVGTFVKD